MQTQIKYLSLFHVIVASLGGLQFGFNTAIIAGVLLSVTRIFYLTQWQQGIFASSILLGALVGSSSSGILADRFGRKGAQQCSAIIFIIGGIILLFAGTFHLFVFGRFIQGLGVGIVSMVVPMYLAEIAPSKYRGAYVSVNQLAITMGIVLAYLLNWLFVYRDWHIIFFVSIGIAVTYLIGLTFIPESTAYRQKMKSGKNIWKLLFFRKRLRRILGFGVILSALQQFTGINIVIYFAPTILQAIGNTETGYAISTALFLSVINVIATIISLWLIDQIGRRKLLVTSVFFMMLSLFTIGIGLYSNGMMVKSITFASLIIYIVAFAIGMGPITWLLISEIYPIRIRGQAMSIATFANWLSNYIVSLTFLPIMYMLTPSGAFLLYGFIALFALLFVFKRVPETKGKSLVEISKELNVNSL
ncbi:MAG: MFS transporter [Chlamydiales bacterium]